MAEQTFTLHKSHFDSDGQWPRLGINPSSLSITDSDLVAGASEASPVYIHFFDVTQVVEVRLSTTLSASTRAGTGDVGPRFTSDVETNNYALFLRASAVTDSSISRTLIIPGPRASYVAPIARDSSEPYSWNPDSALWGATIRNTAPESFQNFATRSAAWFNNIPSTATIELRISDVPAPPVDLSVVGSVPSISTGTVSVSVGSSGTIGLSVSGSIPSLSAGSAVLAVDRIGLSVSGSIPSIIGSSVAVLVDTIGLSVSGSIPSLVSGSVDLTIGSSGAIPLKVSGGIAPLVDSGFVTVQVYNIVSLGVRGFVPELMDGFVSVRIANRIFNAPEGVIKIGSTDDAEFEIAIGETLTVDIEANMRTYEASTQPGVLRVDEWASVVVTYDGTAIKVFVDGVDVGVLTVHLIPSFTSALSGIVLGGTGFDTELTDVFSGDISDVVIWNKALSDAEVRAYSEDNTYDRAVTGQSYL